MVKLSKKDLITIAGVIGAIDFAYEGALTKPVSKAVKAALRAGAAKAFLNPGQIPTNTQLAMGIGRSVGRQAVRLPGTALAVGRTIAMRHPILTAGAVVYYTYKNRDELGGLIEQGYELVQPGLQALTDLDAPIVGTRRPAFTKKKQTKFNKAVSKGMKVVKASTSYGKKGTITNAKKAFSVVTKTASKINQGRKVAKKGVIRKIGLAIKGILK
jgi:hypothetical protein